MLTREQGFALADREFVRDRRRVDRLLAQMRQAYEDDWLRASLDDPAFQAHQERILADLMEAQSLGMECE